MKQLKQTTKLVKDILQDDKQARNSDSFLYMKVLTAIGAEKDIDIHSMPITVFLLNIREYGFPPFESVRRARQKIQAKHPELAACDAVRAFRGENEAKYREYARS
jgi:hypothetical protein